MNNIMIGLPIILIRLIEAYETIIVVFALLTWFPGASQSKLGQWIARIVTPFLNIIDRFVPSIGGIGFSPLIAILILELLSRIIIWVAV